ncbi:hypothetical protein F5Y10DRAFT_267420 [Nemania abortiva]|nr:hypothetical protein F5Y10DRAFT_267420 [Nemania abortiva]
MDISTVPKIPPFQLYLVPSDADYHTRNEGDEVNRSNITDDATDGFIVQASLEKVIHSMADKLDSFIGLHFAFRGANSQRQLKSVNITIRFEDETKPLIDDPEVLHMWPNTEYAWQSTGKDVVDTKSIVTSAKLSVFGIEVGPEGMWQREEKFVRNRPARLSGERTLLKRHAGSHKNAVRIRMSENPQEQSGILRELRSGILLRRKQAGTARFKAYIDIEAEADFRYDIVRGWKKLVGTQHVTDPVVFQPGTNFLDEINVAGINDQLPSFDMVEAYGQAAMATGLDSASMKVVKNLGEGGDEV